MDRRSFVIGTAASAATLAAGQAPAQEAYPTHAITMISPFPPGGVSDTITRPLDAALEAVFKQPVVLENKTGAAGAVGAQYVAAAKPDGYTLLSHIVSISGFAAVDKLFGRQPKFTNADFIPICARRRRSDRLDRQQGCALQHAEGPCRRRQGKSEQGDLQLVGTLWRVSHPNGAVCKAAGDLQMRHLPTNGGGPAVTAVLGGNVNFFMSPTSIALTHIRAGKVDALAVSSAKRVKALPDVPTFKELGYNLEYYFWVGFSRQRVRRRQSSTRCGKDSKRPRTAGSFSTRSTISARNSTILTSRNSRNSGKPTPSGRKTRSIPSVACRDNLAYTEAPRQRGFGLSSA